MNLETLKKQWNKYCDEFESTEEMDIEKHINMASKVGLLIKEIERLNNELTGYKLSIQSLSNALDKEIKGKY